MLLYSTNDTSLRADFADAVFQALPKDRGLYMPVDVPELPAEFWRGLADMSLTDIGTAVSHALLHEEFSFETIQRIVEDAIDFPAPLVKLESGESADTSNYILELFHGPSMAFKDFGARFMAGIMSELLQEREEHLTILVATSGDTGGAVAAGFHGRENIDVCILYPKGGVSAIQEAQLTTFGGNVRALRVDGSFDDCQALVKQAFVDDELRDQLNISSANSINILRLIPQSFYYIDAYRQWQLAGNTGAPVFSVPSGNFGNLTAGLLAHKMGLPVARFVAATNANDTVVRYRASGKYEPRASVKTLSNAMDVGAPSNFPRLKMLLGSTWNDFKALIYAASFTDEQTEAEMAREADSTSGSGYLLDPHTAVGLLGLKQYQEEGNDSSGIVLATAHPGKFQQDVERIIGKPISLPEQLAKVTQLLEQVDDLPNEYCRFREAILASN